MSGVKPFQIGYGLGQQTKPIWKTQTVSGGIGYKNIGKIGIPTGPSDVPCNFNTWKNRCNNKCLAVNDGPMSVARFRWCCEKCGGYFVSEGAGDGYCVGLYDGNCHPMMPMGGL